MNMVCSRLALRLLARADASGAQEALIGDLLEEISSGRSRWWLYQQLIGLYGYALAEHARRHARLTPLVVAVALGAVLLGGLSIASFSSVLVVWLAFYLVMGTLSLFAHMAARAQVNVRL
jgi:hypothetical protein